ncbi:hypothetical protein Pth03_23070 [Planotetraspora thailandica]|uniref:Hemerythrin-like domain-containing protein n=1 Tax=Planotetraspora thailandica TaxID=487172 RepID=A0A8J3UZ82_9ACTN|nr:hemerythrin domain-containing protein [Planotetraspora thailandica]GII53918.1 hypothetical protein Pth03_23070 [Planotetraspora thailandica]
MPQSPGLSEGQSIYEELLAVHTIMRRGAALTASATRRLAQGIPVGVKAPVNVQAIVRTARWQGEFVHHHHSSEDELFWPVLRRLFPGAVAALDELTAEHEKLDAELKSLSVAVDAVSREGAAASGGRNAGLAAESAERVHDLLTAHLDDEEPVLEDLFPLVPDADIRRLRAAIIAGAPRSGPELVLGLLHDPRPAPGLDIMMGNFPAPVRLLKPLLLRRYLARKSALGE